MPGIEDNEILVRVKACGICGSIIKKEINYQNNKKRV